MSGKRAGCARRDAGDIALGLSVLNGSHSLGAAAMALDRTIMK